MDEDADMAGGRPRKELSDEDFNRIVGMMSIQCTQDEICGVFGMSPDTLDRRIKDRGEACFADLYKKNQSKGKASLRRMQWKAAESGNPTMLVWLGKNELGQTDKVINEHMGKDGGAIKIESGQRLTDEELEVIAAGGRKAIT